jgi:hypothetical protein
MAVVLDAQIESGEKVSQAAGSPASPAGASD